ncbi:MAG TPA: ABC transporter ATP-binding protein, partial [Candidatus Angelobacter sp.]|nr:ABC transporter ATP-binding protein [Candidatus Angelobacter sp.]
DNGIIKKDLSAVWHWGAIMVGISFCGFVAGVTNSYFASHTGQSFGFDLRVNLFKKIQTFSFANFNQFPTSSLVTRMTNDITQVQNTVFMSLRIMLRAPLLVIGGTIMALVVNFRLALFLAIVIPFLVCFLIWAMRRGGRLFRWVQEQLDQVNSTMRENLTAVRLIKALLRGPFEFTRFSRASGDLKDRTVSALRLMETTMPILLVVMNMSLIGIIWFGNIQLHNGGTQVGDVVAIVNYATRITAAFTPLSFIIMAVSRGRASAARLSKVLNEPVDLTDHEASNKEFQIEGSLKFDQVSFKYPESETEVLSDISFEIEAAQTVAIIGATGSGKSSLFQLIPRLYDVTKGALYVDGEDVRSFPFDSLRKQIGYVPQEALLFSGSVQENIEWGKERASFEEVTAAAKHAQIHETILGLPNQYQTVLGQKGINLSGGQKQRLSIARALVRHPKILLLDDSTSALDLKTEAQLLKAIKENYTCTTVIITQKVSTAKSADHILLLDEGELICKGTHTELLKTSRLYQAIVESQLGKEEAQC